VGSSYESVVVVSERAACGKVTKQRLDVNQPELRNALVFSELAGAGAVRVVVPVRRNEKEGDDEALGEAVQLGVISAARVSFHQTVWQEWRAAPSPEASFASDETKDRSGVVPNFFVRSRPGPTASWARKLAYHATDTFTPVYEDTYLQMIDDCDVVRAAVDHVSNTQGMLPKFAYALTVYPGHHASADQYGGYCFVNHAVLAVKMLASKGFSPMLVDVDYHAGDGSAALLLGDERAQDDGAGHSSTFLSLHAPQDYPYVDSSAEGPARTWTVPLPPGCTGEAYCALLEGALAARKPESCTALVVSLGFDCLAGDPCATPGHATALDPVDFASIRKVLQRHFHGLPMLVVQEGGYALELIPRAARHFWDGA